MSKGARFEEQPTPKQPAKCFLNHKTMGLTKPLAAIIASKRLLCLVCSCLANMFASPFEDNAAAAQHA